jgi:chlorite dismutase
VGEQQGERRQVVKFSFYSVTPVWRGLPAAERQAHKAAFCAAVAGFSDRLHVRSYSVVGLRGDADILLWQIGDRLDDIQELAASIMRTPMAPYLNTSYSYLAMTRRSTYVSGEEARARAQLHPSQSRYFFVYPFVKTREWYQLPLEERQRMMDQHIAVGRKYPSVKLNTTYSFGLDDQEFVVSFETDSPEDFLDLVMELREAKSSIYTLRDTPIFTCIAMSLPEALDTLGGAGEPVALQPSGNGAGNSPVAATAEIPDGGSKVVYFRGEQVALFNTGGNIYAVANRCSHANGPLADGEISDNMVTCPYHASQFDLRTGEPHCGPASRPLQRFDVRIEGGNVYLAPQSGAPVV